MQNTSIILAGKPQLKGSLGRPRHRWERKSEMTLTDTGCKGAYWIQLAQDTLQSWAFVSMVKFRVWILSLRKHTVSPLQGSVRLLTFGETLFFKERNNNNNNNNNNNAIVVIIIVPVKYLARWPVTASYFPCWTPN